MCGIFGYALRGGGDPPDLGVALRAIHHRGPDDRGTFVEHTDAARVGFAHTRLAIIDLSPGGHQPMASHDGRYTVAYNGEIYNFADVRRELEGLGVRFRSTSDTEVLIEGYARWGKDCLSRLRGMFALAIWDTRTKALFLARDRLGVKPLYYVERDGGLVFASEVRALLATGAASRRISEGAVASYLLYGSVREPDAIVQGVRALPAGTWLEATAKGVHIERYWSLPLTQDPGIGAEEAASSLRKILEDSVRLRLVADVPVGVFLSGGVDSAAIVALASRAASSPVRTFTVTFDAGAHEGEHAAETARAFGCQHTEARLETQAIAGRMDAALGALDQPSGDGVNTFFVSEAARASGLAVALSGVGGDELFAGYPAFRRFALARQLLAVGLPRFARRSAAAATAWPGLSNAARKVAALLASDGSAEGTYEVFRAAFVPAQRDALLARHHHVNGTHPAGPVEAALARGSLDAANAYGALEIQNYLLHTLLRDTDSMSMAHALEVREPLVDHVLVEYAMRVPGHVKLRGEGNKPLFAAAVPEVASVSRARKKSGFVLPFDVWLRGPLRGWLVEKLVSGARRHPFASEARVGELLRGFEARSAGVSWQRVFCLAVLYDYCDRHQLSV